jgi:hypothetical protein
MSADSLDLEKTMRSVAAVYVRASKLAVTLGGGRGRKGHEVI